MKGKKNFEKGKIRKMATSFYMALSFLYHNRLLVPSSQHLANLSQKLGETSDTSEKRSVVAGFSHPSSTKIITEYTKFIESREHSEEVVGIRHRFDVRVWLQYHLPKNVNIYSATKMQIQSKALRVCSI